MTPFSPVIQNWACDPKPVKVGEGDNQQSVTRIEDFVNAMESSEQALGQIITQHNEDTSRVSALITDTGLTTLSSSAILTEVIAEVNKINSILTQLIQVGKNG